MVRPPTDPVNARVRVRAPVRILDAGGWTDTWFAGHGAVCNLAVSEGTQVDVDLSASGGGRDSIVDLHVAFFGDRYHYALSSPPNRHPLIEAAIRRWCPPCTAVRVGVESSVPPGSGLGTSASVVVALVMALRGAAGTVAPTEEIATEAHRIETEDLGLQSGVQDQIAAAYGGANLLTVADYPKAEVRSLEVGADTWEELGRRLVTVYLGEPHRSSSVHEAVLTRLFSLSPSDRDELLRPLREAAHRSAAALVAGDIDGYGDAMIRNTEGQAALHPGLVGRQARAVIERISSHGVAGWKVNGAGGEGGSVTFVCPDDPAAVIAELDSMRGVSRLTLQPTHEGARFVDVD